MSIYRGPGVSDYIVITALTVCNYMHLIRNMNHEVAKNTHAWRCLSMYLDKPPRDERLGASQPMLGTTKCQAHHILPLIDEGL